MTFDECADAYGRAHEISWQNAKHRKQWSNPLAKYVSPVFGSLAVQNVDVSLVTKAIEPIWSMKPETASRVRGRLEAVSDCATVRGVCAGQNPARVRGKRHTLL